MALTWLEKIKALWTRFSLGWESFSGSIEEESEIERKTVKILSNDSSWIFVVAVSDECSLPPLRHGWCSADMI